MSDINKDKWINIKKKLPEHNQIILVYSDMQKGYGVAVFVDSVKMNEELWKNGYGNDVVNVKEHPYYFASLEVKQHTYNTVSHWMPLPSPPELPK